MRIAPHRRTLLSTQRERAFAFIDLPGSLWPNTRVTTTWLQLRQLAGGIALAAALPSTLVAQDFTTYETVRNPARYGTYWAAFYTRANELTAKTRDTLPHHLDIAYGSDPKQALDIYLPLKGAQKSGAKAPVLLFLHGGGFKEGDRTHYGFVAAPYARHGIITVVAGYRLATPGVHYPAQPDDTKAAILWIHKNIAKYGGDPETIFLSGHSVGATLLADISFDRDWLENAGVSPDAIKGIAAVSGDYDLGPGENTAYAPNAQLEERASPLRRIVAPPPVAVIACGTEEGKMQASAEDLNKRLQGKGVKTQLVVLQGADHKDTVLALGEEGSALSKAVLKMIRPVVEP